MVSYTFPLLNEQLIFSDIEILTSQKIMSYEGLFYVLYVYEYYSSSYVVIVNLIIFSEIFEDSGFLHFANKY